MYVQKWYRVNQRLYVSQALLLLILLTLGVGFRPLPGEVAAAGPVTLKATIATDQLTATQDGEYKVLLEASSASSRPPSKNEPLSLKKGESIKLSQEFLFSDPDFKWKLTVTPPSTTNIQVRPLILEGNISQATIAALLNPTSKSNPEMPPSALYPYLQSQPASHGLDVGDTPVYMKLTVFTAEMYTCSLLTKGFEGGKYTVRLWMDGNDNKQREQSEELMQEAEPKDSGELCVGPLTLPSFVEQSNFEYDIDDPKGQKLAPAKGTLNFASKTVSDARLATGDRLHYTGFAFDSTSTELEIRMKNPFTAQLNLAAVGQPTTKPIQVCTNDPLFPCPSMVEKAKEFVDTTPWWKLRWNKFTQNRGYVPFIAVGFGVLALALAWFRPWPLSYIGKRKSR